MAVQPGTVVVVDSFRRNVFLCFASVFFGVWKALLGLSAVSSHDNFFDLGGHSLLAVQAHREIRQATGKELTVTDMFRFPTIAGLAAHLDGDGGASESLAKSAGRAAARRQARGKRRVLRRR